MSFVRLLFFEKVTKRMEERSKYLFISATTSIVTTTGTGDKEEQWDYERERQRNIENNLSKLEELGLSPAVVRFSIFLFLIVK